MVQPYTFLTFDVVSDPKPQPRPRARVVPLGNGKVRAGVYTKQDKCADWRADVLRALADAKLEGLLIETPVIVLQKFKFRRPHNHYGTGRNADTLKANAPAFPTGGRSGDVDNLSKGLLDTLIRGRVITGDNNVVMAPIFKDYVLREQAPGATVGILVLPREGGAFVARELFDGVWNSCARAVSSE